MISKRRLLAQGAAGLACVAVTPAGAREPVSMARHERFMRLAIAEGRKNPFAPFGAVIWRQLLAPSCGVKLTPSTSLPKVWKEKEIFCGLLVFNESPAVSPSGITVV